MFAALRFPAAKLTLLCTLFAIWTFLLASPVCSQPSPIPNSQEEFEKQIGITEEQKSKMTAITQKYKPKIDQLIKERSAKIANAKNKKQSLSIQRQLDVKIKALSDAALAEMQAAFTPQQRLQIKQMQVTVKRQQVHVKGCPLTDYEIATTIKKCRLWLKNRSSILIDPESYIYAAEVIEHGSYNKDGKYWPFKVKLSLKDRVSAPKSYPVVLECMTKKNDYGTYDVQTTASSEYYLRERTAEERDFDQKEALAQQQAGTFKKMFPRFKEDNSNAVVLKRITKQQNITVLETWDNGSFEIGTGVVILYRNQKITLDDLRPNDKLLIATDEQLHGDHFVVVGIAVSRK